MISTSLCKRSSADFYLETEDRLTKHPRRERPVKFVSILIPGDEHTIDKENLEITDQEINCENITDIQRGVESLSNVTDSGLITKLRETNSLVPNCIDKCANIDSNLEHSVVVRKCGASGHYYYNSSNILPQQAIDFISTFTTDYELQIRSDFVGSNKKDSFNDSVANFGSDNTSTKTDVDVRVSSVSVFPPPKMIVDLTGKIDLVKKPFITKTTAPLSNYSTISTIVIDSRTKGTLVNFPTTITTSATLSTVSGVSNGSNGSSVSGVSGVDSTGKRCATNTRNRYETFTISNPFWKTREKRFICLSIPKMAERSDLVRIMSSYCLYTSRVFESTELSRMVKNPKNDKVILMVDVRKCSESIPEISNMTKRTFLHHIKSVAHSIFGKNNVETLVRRRVTNKYGYELLWNQGV